MLSGTLLFNISIVLVVVLSGLFTDKPNSPAFRGTVVFVGAINSSETDVQFFRYFRSKLHTQFCGKHADWAVFQSYIYFSLTRLKISRAD